MSREIIIGKEGNQLIPIKGDSVSRQHAKLIVQDNGTIILEDMKSTNGTYVRNANGDFERISRVQVKEDTVVRLGYAGIHSFTFWVHHMLINTPTDYSFEFRRILQLYNMNVRQKQKDLMKKNDMREYASIIAPILGLSLSFLFSANPLMIRMSITLPTLAVGIFFLGYAKKMRHINEYRQKFITCPHCGKPLTDYDLQQQQCQACKAHS